jgi:hypothetical protein
MKEMQMDNELLPLFNGVLTILNKEDDSFKNQPVQLYKGKDVYALIIYKCDGSDNSLIASCISGIIAQFKIQKDNMLKVFINEGDPLFDGKTGIFETKLVEYVIQDDVFEIKVIEE